MFNRRKAESEGVVEEEIEELKARVKELEDELEKANEWQEDIQKWLDNCPR